MPPEGNVGDRRDNWSVAGVERKSAPSPIGESFRIGTVWVAQIPFFQEPFSGDAENASHGVGSLLEVIIFRTVPPRHPFGQLHSRQIPVASIASFDIR